MDLSSDSFIRFAKKLEAIENEQFNLWTWLPSYQLARKHHGYYASDLTPVTPDIIKEACDYICHLRNPEQTLSQETQELFNTCPCGESHE